MHKNAKHAYFFLMHGVRLLREGNNYA